jgi:hypothetical protein
VADERRSARDRRQDAARGFSTRAIRSASRTLPLRAARQFRPAVSGGISDGLEGVDDRIADVAKALAAAARGVGPTPATVAASG